ncbi:MAG: hypothetical protein WBZ37_20615 [Mycobacterium sp.]
MQSPAGPSAAPARTAPAELTDEQRVGLPRLRGATSTGGVNHAVGKEAPCPFRLNFPAVAKLGFVHHVVVTAAGGNPASASRP